MILSVPPCSPSSRAAAARPSHWWNHSERPVESTGRWLGQLHCGPKTGGPRLHCGSEDPLLGGQRVRLQHPHPRTPVQYHRDNQQRQPDQLHLRDRTDRCVWFLDTATVCCVLMDRNVIIIYVRTGWHDETFWNNINCIREVIPSQGYLYCCSWLVVQRKTVK